MRLDYLVALQDASSLLCLESKYDMASLYKGPQIDVTCPLTRAPPRFWSPNITGQGHEYYSLLSGQQHVTISSADQDRDCSTLVASSRLVLVTLQPQLNG
jgi:hypothetical protein